MVTSSAVVGSSAISSRGSAGQRHRDQRPLPHAAGELVRVLLQPPRRIRDADRVEQVAGLRLAAGRFMPRCRSSTSVTWIPMGTTGFSDDSGSWKIIAMSRPRRSRMSSSGSAAGRCRRTSPAPATLDPAPGQQPHDRQRGHRLAAAGLADQADGLPGRHLEADPVHGRTAARPAGGTRRSRRRAVARSPLATASPLITLTAITAALRVDGLPHGLAQQGEPERDDDDGHRRLERQPRPESMYVCASPSISPTRLRYVRAPSPRKDSAAASMIAVAGQRRLDDHRGQRVGHHVPEHDGARRTPSARAASTWSRSRWASIDPRSSRAKTGTVTPTAMITGSGSPTSPQG